MKTLSIKRILLLKVFGFLILFQTTLFSENVYYVSSNNTTIVNSKVVKSSDTKDVGIVGLDSFGEIGVVLMIILISLLGIFFVRYEFNGLID